MSQSNSVTKTKKSKNFTAAENGVLVEEVEVRKTILFSKFNNNNTNRMKQEAWEHITRKVNSVNSSTDRNWMNVKKHWQDMQSRIKKKESERRREIRKTGGGPGVQPLTDVEDKVVSILGETAIEGIPDGEDSFEDMVVSEMFDPQPDMSDVLAEPFTDARFEHEAAVPPCPKKSLETELLLCEQKRQEQESIKLTLFQHFLTLKEKEVSLREEELAVQKARLDLERKRYELENSRSLLPVPVLVTTGTEE